MNRNAFGDFRTKDEEIEDYPFILLEGHGWGWLTTADERQNDFEKQQQMVWNSISKILSLC